MADEVAYLAEGETLLWALEDGHGDQSDVGIGRFSPKCSCSSLRDTRKMGRGPCPPSYVPGRMQKELKVKDVRLQTLCHLSNHVDNKVIH